MWDEWPIVLDLGADRPLRVGTGLLDASGRPIYRRRPVGFHAPDREYVVDPEDKPVDKSATT